LGEDPRDRPVQREQPLVTPEPALALVERSPQAFQLVRRLHLRDGSFHSHSPPPGTAGSCYGARRAFAASQIPRGAKENVISVSFRRAPFYNSLTINRFGGPRPPAPSVR